MDIDVDIEVVMDARLSALSQSLDLQLLFTLPLLLNFTGFFNMALEVSASDVDVTVNVEAGLVLVDASV